MNKEMMNLKKETITQLNSREMATIKGGGGGKGFSWYMFALSCVGGMVGSGIGGGLIGGTLCGVISIEPLSKNGCTSSICGS